MLYRQLFIYTPCCLSARYPAARRNHLVSAGLLPVKAKAIEAQVVKIRNGRMDIDSSEATNTNFA
jgi:hypothetical protein